MQSDPNLPSESDLVSLTLRARVAFVARCVRRVLPMLSVMQDVDKDKIDTAVAIANDVASRSAPVNSNMSSICSHVTVTSWKAKRAASITEAVAAAADFACTTNALTDYPNVTFDSVEALNVQEAMHAVSAAYSANPSPMHANAILRDYRTLLEHQHQNDWTHDTPVTQDIFGPFFVDEDDE